MYYFWRIFKQFWVQVCLIFGIHKLSRYTYIWHVLPFFFMLIKYCVLYTQFSTYQYYYSFLISQRIKLYIFLRWKKNTFFSCQIPNAFTARVIDHPSRVRAPFNHRAKKCYVTAALPHTSISFARNKFTRRLNNFRVCCWRIFTSVPTVSVDQK